MITEMQKILHDIAEKKEEILTAFIAKHGCGPDEVEMIQETNGNKVHWWVERKKIKPHIEPLPFSRTIALCEITNPIAEWCRELQKKQSEIIAWIEYHDGVRK